MSAAIEQECVVCHASSSKYKCPTCRSPTCSLNCSRDHAAHEHTSSQSSQRADISFGESDKSLPPLKIQNEILKAPPAHRFSKVGKFISMKEYDSTQFLEDFEYLQHVGNCVGMLGKDIVKNGWLREMEERAAVATSSSQQHNSSHRGRLNGRGGSSRPHQNISAEVKTRQTLESWIRKAKLPIMLIPNGMTWRKENQTWWKNSTRELFCTVEIKVASSQKVSEKRSIIHRISWDKKFMNIVTEDLEKRMKRKSSTVGGMASILQKYCDEKGRLTSDDWKKQFCVVVEVANDRLRNESSSKFLEWWQRQVKNGMVKKDGLELDEEKRIALEEMRRGAWGDIEGIEIIASNSGRLDVNAIESNKAILETSQVDTGLISPAFLSKLQAARAKVEEQEVTKRKEEELVIRPKRNVVLLDGKETFQDFLRYLPTGFAIVEYFHLEIWERNLLMEQIKNGNLIRIQLEGRKEIALESAAELRKRALNTLAERQMAAKKAKTENQIVSNGLISLNAYDTSSDEEAEIENLDGEDASESGSIHDDGLASIPATIGSLAELARSLGMVKSG